MFVSKYYQAPSSQSPIMSEDNRTVIGWNLTVKLLCDGYVVNHEARYEMDPVDQFPISQVNERMTASTLKGHEILSTFETAEAKMDALVAGDE